MSFSGAKSNADKNNGSAQVTPSPMQELNYILSGRLTQAQWMDMLIYEEADEIVGEIMDELLSMVMEGCLKVYVERQIAPFSVSWAKSYITKILEQKILYPDVGDEPKEASKTEDSEPLPAIPDSLAQGCVPVVTSPLQQEAGNVQISVQEEPVVDQQGGTVARRDSFPKQSEMETSTERSVSDQSFKVLIPQPPPKPVQKKRRRVNVFLKPVPGKLLPSLSTSAETKIVELKSKSRAHSYQPKPIPKIDPASLPRHCVIPQYEIVDDNGPKLKKTSGLSKLQPKYDQQQTEWTAVSLKPLTLTKDQSAGFQMRDEKDVFLKKISTSTQSNEGIASSGSLRLDKMVLAKGVSLLDPKAAEMNPLIFNPNGQSTKLRPIRSDVAVPLISADQITAGPPPKIIPLFESNNKIHR